MPAICVLMGSASYLVVSQGTASRVLWRGGCGGHVHCLPCYGIGSAVPSSAGQLRAD